MTWLAGLVVAVSGLALVAFTGVVFAKPALAERFLMSFASSARTHYLEMAYRLVLGTSLLVVAPPTWPPSLLRFLGWAIVVSSVVLLLLPWHWHHRFGMRVRPALIRFVNVYALGAFAIGCLLLYGVVRAGFRGAP